MNLLDILLLIIAVSSVFAGWNKGLVGRIGDIAAFIVGIIAARLFGGSLSGFYEMFMSNNYATILSYITIFVIFYIAVKTIAKALKFALRVVGLTIVDRLGGAVFTLVEWMFFASLLLQIWVIVSPNKIKYIDHGGKTSFSECVYEFAPTIAGYVEEL